MKSNSSKTPIAVLISGNGSNLQAMIDAIEQGLPAKIVVVISNKADAYGLTRAKKANIPTEVISQKAYDSRNEYDKALKKCLLAYAPEYIILAGFMRILTPAFVNVFSNRILNIHPSLLPKYPGLNTHKKVLENKDKYHGATVHIVTAELDAGPILGQAKLEVSPEDDEASLQARVQQLEHKLYPEVIRKWLDQANF